MDIRVLGKSDLPLASSLVWNVFSEFVAPGYSEEGIKTFRNFIQPEELEKSILSGRFFIGCLYKWSTCRCFSDKG